MHQLRCVDAGTAHLPLAHQAAKPPPEPQRPPVLSLVSRLLCRNPRGCLRCKRATQAFPARPAAPPAPARRPPRRAPSRPPRPACPARVPAPSTPWSPGAQAATAPSTSVVGARRQGRTARGALDPAGRAAAVTKRRDAVARRRAGWLGESRGRWFRELRGACGRGRRRRRGGGAGGRRCVERLPRRGTGRTPFLRKEGKVESLQRHRKG